MFQNISSTVWFIPPDLPTSKTYEEILKLLRKHLCKKINILSEIIFALFFTRKQHEDKSVNSYVTSSKELFITTDITSDYENINCLKSIIILLLRVQFLRSLYDADNYENLLQQSDVSFEQTLETTL